MRIDFYQAGRDQGGQSQTGAVIAMLADKTLGAGERLLVVAADGASLDALSRALWEATIRGAAGGREPTFLANGRAGAGHEERQPILLAEAVEPANGARFVALADGLWREEAADASRFDRAFLVFDEATLEGARACWRMLGEREGLERNFWKQDGGRWVRAG